MVKLSRRVTATAPGKLMLLGEHAVVYDHPCLVTTVGQYMKVTVEMIGEKYLELHAPDVGVEEYRKSYGELGTGDIPKGARFTEEAVRGMFQKFKINAGVRVDTESQFGAHLGFGSSSAAVVCIVKALNELFDLHLTLREIFDECLAIVRAVQKAGSGFDIAAALFGGTLHFVTGGKVIEPLPIKALPLVIGYTGVKADTAAIVKEVKERADPAFIKNIYEQIELLVTQAREYLLRGDFRELGRVMRANQLLLADLTVSSPKLDVLIASAHEAGAYGAKLSGAGRGDCMIALVPERQRATVAKAIESAGGQVIDVPVNVPGATLESSL